MSARRRPVVAVVGGGIAGLAAAWELATSEEGPAPEVVLLEAGTRVGGSLRSAEFAGRAVDIAADAFLARRPEATELCAELGLAGQLVPVGATGASVWARGRLRPLPAGLNLGVPTRWWPLARSGIVSPAEALRVARDLVQPHLRVGGITSDQAVGSIVEARLGRPVVDRLVDPLVGGINAGDVDDLSAAATFPYLLAASLQPGSLMRRLGRQLEAAEPTASEPNTSEPTTRAERRPLFWSLPGGVASLADHLSAELARRGVDRRTGVAVEAVRRPGPGPGQQGRWRLDLRADRAFTLDVDGVVMAVPAREAAVLLATHAPAAAGLLSTIEYASVAVVTLALPKGAIGAPLFGTGFLVPRTGTIGGASPLMTAATYLGRKWPHLAREGDELIRVSVGRFGDLRHQGLDDDELCRSVMGELAEVLDGRDRPIESMVTRWARALPQYRVGHLLGVARVEQEIAALGGMAVAGAAYRGVGIPACIGGGRDAARRVLGFLSSPTGSAPSSVGEGGP